MSVMGRDVQSQSIVTSYGLESWGSIPGKDRYFILFVLLRLSKPNCLLHQGYKEFFLQGMRQVCETVTQNITQRKVTTTTLVYLILQYVST